MWLFFTRTYLGTEAVAVLIKNKIHAALGKGRFFIKIAASLGFLATGRTDRHLFLPAKNHHQLSHPDFLPMSQSFTSF
jgi:hypothetical protein